MPATIDELFPPSQRVFYRKAPLAQVIGQLNFPRLLAIESQPPAHFQERIRGEFPLLERGLGINFPAGQQIPNELAQLISAQMGGGSYQFLSNNRSEVMTLTSESLSYSTTSYAQWPEFIAKFNRAIAALKEIYSPSFFTRVGLRYSNAINRHSIALEGRPWSALLSKKILDAIAFPDLEESIQLLQHQICLRLPDGSGSIFLRHGFGANAERQGISYIMDFDFFKEDQIEVANVDEILAHFNALSGRAFRGCIEPELHNALEPEPLE